MNYLEKPLIDHRIYTIKLRRMGEFLDVFDRLVMPILLQTLGHPVGFYSSLVGRRTSLSTSGAMTTWLTTSAAARRATRTRISRRVWRPPST